MWLANKIHYLTAPTFIKVRFHSACLSDLHLSAETSLKRTKVEGVHILNLPHLAYLLQMAHCFCNPYKYSLRQAC